jgi:hypothetical protein
MRRRDLKLKRFDKVRLTNGKIAIIYEALEEGKTYQGTIQTSGDIFKDGIINVDDIVGIFRKVEQPLPTSLPVL